MKKIQNIFRKFKSIKSWFVKRSLPFKIGAVLAVTGLIWIIFSKVRSGNQQPQYQTAVVEKGTIVYSVPASGQILTSNLSYVTTQASGLVKKIYVKDGDRVYKGQILAEILLDSDGELANKKAWASLVSARNSLNSAKNSYRQTQASLQKVYDEVKGHDSDETFTQKETRTKAEVANDNAYDQIKTAEASLASASLAYRQSSPKIVASMDGVIDNITIAIGLVLSTDSSTAASSNRVAVVASKNNPIATFNVSEVDVSKVKPEQKATITLDSIPDKTFTGKVLTVDKIGVVSLGVTNYPVLILFDTKASEILPNMAATANIIIESKQNVLLVPSEAVNDSNGVNIVRVLRDEKLQEISVETGLTSDSQTEIMSGLSEGDRVVVSTLERNGSQRSSSTSPFSTFRVGGSAGGAVFRSGGGGR